MGKVVKSFTSIFTGGKKPKASTASQEQASEEKEDTSKQRRALYETEGGASGQELSDEDVKQRNTLFGN